MTLKELAKGLNIDIETITGILGIPPDIHGSTKIFDKKISIILNVACPH